MATRSTIKIEGIDFVKIYKHFDGYPSAMTKWLSEFNKLFVDNRGDDPEYKIAQLLRFSSKYEDKYHLDDSEYSGWGLISFNSDAGEDYEYILKKDGSVEIVDK